MFKETTIAAISTSTNIGGIGVVRLSGSQSLEIAQKMTGISNFKPRYAYFSRFCDKEGLPIDEGIVLYYQGPNSFTGENIVEFQGHGGLTVLSRVLARCIELGAVPARCGEFSERAFFNGKLDLIQAEAIHDLIVSQSEAQAKAAMNSLSGGFSKHVNQLLQTLIEFRVYIEASIDFSEEDIDFISDGKVREGLDHLNIQIEQLMINVGQGKLLTDGAQIVIAGHPNAGKSSLLNALSGEETAIVTDIEGTTRDVLREKIVIEGMPLYIIDTAGLRATDNVIEAEGIKRARAEMSRADLILWLHDDTMNERAIDDNVQSSGIPIIYIHNKIDLSQKEAGVYKDHIAISLKNGEGLLAVKKAILEHIGFTNREGLFSARERHIFALKSVLEHLSQALILIQELHSIDLVAEELRLAQKALGEVTGEFTSDELLGEIFSNFCVGK